MSIHTVEIALPSGITIVEIRQGPAGTGGSSTWDSLTGTASQVPFEPVTPPAYAEGLVFYDTDDKSLVYYGDEPDIAMNIGRELWVRVRNDSGAPILNGKVVYINDAVGQLPTIRLARSDSAATSRVIGIATHDIGNNEFGYVTTAGEVKGLNTVAFQDGDLLFLSADTAGEMTTTAPTAPNRVIQVATVLHAHISQGKLYCHPENDSVPSTGIVDSTATGRALITAVDSAAARATLTLGSTDSVSFGQLTATATSSNQHTIASSAGTNITGPLSLSGTSSDTLTATYTNTITLTGTMGVTIAGGTLTFNSSGFAYGTGAAAAHRTALGLGTGDTPTFYGLDLIDGTTTTLNLYNLLSGGNTERLSFRWDSSSGTPVARIGTLKTGTGVARDIVLETDGTERARISAAGLFTAVQAIQSGASTTYAKLVPDIADQAGVDCYSPQWSLKIQGIRYYKITAGAFYPHNATGQSCGLDIRRWSNVFTALVNSTGDMEVTDSTKGVILKSPDGTRYRVTVANGGALTTTAI